MDYLNRLSLENNIELDLDVTSKKRVFDQAGLLLEKSSGISRKDIFQAILEREKLGSTALGNGVAIPHGRLKKLRRSAGAFLRTKHGIQFEAPDGNPVRLFFFLIVPDKATERHLQVLSELVQIFGIEDLRHQLEISNDLSAIYKIFCGEK